MYPVTKQQNASSIRLANLSPAFIDFRKSEFICFCSSNCVCSVNKPHFARKKNYKNVRTHKLQKHSRQKCFKCVEFSSMQIFLHKSHGWRCILSKYICHPRGDHSCAINLKKLLQFPQNFQLSTFTLSLDAFILVYCINLLTKKNDPTFWYFNCVWKQKGNFI